VSKAGFATTWSRGHFRKSLPLLQIYFALVGFERLEQGRSTTRPATSDYEMETVAMKGQMCASEYFSVLPVCLQARIQSCIEGLVAELPRFSHDVANVVVCSSLLTI
jgi:hypothetical protein